MKFPKKILIFVLLLLPIAAMAGKKSKRISVEMETTMGTIEVVLYNETPVHRDNFVKLVRQGFYDGLLFHRVIRGFMIQSGDPDSRNAVPGQKLGEGEAGPWYIPTSPCPSKGGESNLTMADHSDFTEPPLGGTGGSPVFGGVTRGLDIAEKIQTVATDPNDRPLEDVRITRARVVTESH